jgi:DeoR family transcriptional regulator, fructose operon transcriptional repressor
MLAVDRQHRILALMQVHRSMTLEALAGEVGVSSSTIRRDLEQIEPAGQVQRTHGGAVYVGDKQSGTRPYAFGQRLGYALDAKRRIAVAAAQLVQPGQTILIDGGTTTFYFAQELKNLPVQIVTNSLPIAEHFQNDERVELILTGGLAYPRYGVLLGPMTDSALQSIHTQTLFLSVAGISAGQLYNQNLLLVQAEQRMIQQSQQVVLLVDSDKFGQQALARLCELSEIDILVTDQAPSDQDAARIAEAGCRLVIA